jgi:hypothetical protein
MVEVKPAAEVRLWRRQTETNATAVNVECHSYRMFLVYGCGEVQGRSLNPHNPLVSGAIPPSLEGRKGVNRYVRKLVAIVHIECTLLLL